MGKKKVRDFSSRSVSILVSDGKVLRCTCGNEKVFPEYGNYHKILKKAMEELYTKSPKKLEELLKCLDSKSIEHDVAENVYAAKIMQDAMDS